MPITAEQCVALLSDELSRRPDDTYSEEAMEWFARVAGTVSAYSKFDSMRLAVLLSEVTRVNAALTGAVAGNFRADACNRFFAEARALETRLKLETNAFVTRQVGRGEVHDYFEEIREIINGAESEVIFIDPYIDAEFVTRYLPQIPQGVTVRLLTSARQVVALAANLAVYRQQHGVHVEVRSLPDKSLHDRHLVIDGRDVYQSGASFKDGGKNAPTSINQIVDIATQMIREHEIRWAAAQVV